jgi:hypothetical protein
MAMAQVAQAHAEMFGRKVVSGEDLAAARRMGLDTIPTTRRRILEAMNEIGQTSYPEVKEVTRQPITSIHYNVVELHALEIVEVGGGTIENAARWVMFGQEFLKLWRDAGLGKA